MSTESKRRIIMVSQAEEFWDGPWLTMVADGISHNRNLNLPNRLDKRTPGFTEYRIDPMLTAIGHLQAKLIGRALRNAEIPFPKQMFSSPATACAETAKGILKGMGLDTKQQRPELIRVETDLYMYPNFMESTSTRIPYFFPLPTLVRMDIPVDVKRSNTLSSKHGLKKEETLSHYHDRTSKIIKEIVDQLRVGETTMIVGHSSSIAPWGRRLIGMCDQSEADLLKLAKKTPHVAVSMIEECAKQKDWRLVAPPIDGFTHIENSNFDWKNFVGKFKPRR